MGREETSSSYTIFIRDLPPEERPRERLMKYGAEVLSVAELIAILLRTGSSKHSAIDLAEIVLSEFGSLRRVAGATIEELAATAGM